ncbi:DUF3592 domain-containing protein [Candidatus Omnitrophota bacterium]
MGNKPNKPALFKALSVILVIIGLFLIIPSQFDINKVNEAKNWLPRKARITLSKVIELRGSSTGDRRYIAEIKGVFLDNNQDFDVYRVSFGQISGQSTGKEHVKMFPVGKTVEVYVSPDDPEKVILIRDVPLTSMHTLQGIGGFLMLIAMALFIKRRQIINL